MTRVTVIGARGFVGSAFVRLLSRQGVELREVARESYADHAGSSSDVVVDASCNSKKFVADERPFEEFDLSVAHRLHTLRDFPAALHLHVSSVDVYDDLTSPESTREDAAIDVSRSSHYGFHKLMAEQLVRHYAPEWLIVRLAGMVGPGLRKNPVFDILNGRPLRIHPESRYQFMSTDDVAASVWSLVESGRTGELFNVCGEGLVSPREIAEMAGRDLDTSLLDPDARPRVVHASTERLARHMPVPSSRDTVRAFIEG